MNSPNSDDVASFLSDEEQKVRREERVELVENVIDVLGRASSIPHQESTSGSHVPIQGVAPSLPDAPPAHVPTTAVIDLAVVTGAVVAIGAEILGRKIVSVVDRVLGRESPAQVSSMETQESHVSQARPDQSQNRDWPSSEPQPGGPGSTERPSNTEALKIETQEALAHQVELDRSQQQDWQASEPEVDGSGSIERLSNAEALRIETLEALERQQGLDRPQQQERQGGSLELGGSSSIERPSDAEALKIEIQEALARQEEIERRQEQERQALGPKQ
jgi:hypothetical protein